MKRSTLLALAGCMALALLSGCAREKQPAVGTGSINLAPAHAPQLAAIDHTRA